MNKLPKELWTHIYQYCDTNTKLAWLGVNTECESLFDGVFIHEREIRLKLTTNINSDNFAMAVINNSNRQLTMDPLLCLMMTSQPIAYKKGDMIDANLLTFDAVYLLHNIRHLFELNDNNCLLLLNEYIVITSINSVIPAVSGAHIILLLITNNQIAVLFTSDFPTAGSYFKIEHCILPVQDIKTYVKSTACIQ